MPRIKDDFGGCDLLFTGNTSWLEDSDDGTAGEDRDQSLEELDSRRALSPEELLTRLEGMLDRGELTQDQALTYLQDLYGA